MRRMIAALLAAAAGQLLAGHALAQPAAERANPGLQALSMDLSPLDRIVGPADVVIFGEDSHGMAAEHNFVRQAFQRLVERKGFRVFVFEAQWGLQDAFRDFMASDRTTLTPTEEFFLDGAFVSSDTTQLLIWIRDFNRAHPDDPILITGFQPEQPVTDARALLAYVKDAAPQDAAGIEASLAPCRAGDATHQTDLDFLNDTFKRRKAGQRAYSPAERTACLAALDKAAAYLDRNAGLLATRTSRARRDVARLHVDSLKAYVGDISLVADEVGSHPDLPMERQLDWQARAYQAGDLARFKLFNTLKRLGYGDRKIFFWMHDWHAARHASETGPITPTSGGIPKGVHSVGERLAGQYGRRLVTIGSVVPCGATCAEPETSVEPPFAAKFGDRPALIDLRVPAETTGLPVARSGAIYANHHGFGFGDVVLARQFDAILYIPSSAKTR